MQVEYFNNFRANVRILIEDGGISQRSLGEIAGLSYPYINRILQGTVNPSIDVCENIAKALGAAFVDLLQKPKDFQKNFTVHT